MQKQENPAVLSLVLFVISAVVALLLAFTHSVTKDKIAENTLKEQLQAKQEVLQEAFDFLDVEFKDETGLVRSLSQGVSGDGKHVGWVANVVPSGYGGAIDVMVGIGLDGNLTGVKVVSHSETAGLGAKAAEDEFPSQYVGKSIQNPLTVIKNGTPKTDEIVAISGATITSRAVTSGVNAAMDAVKRLNGGV